MGATRIEWATDTWQVTAGCTRAGEGCSGCYAERMANRQVGIAAAARAAGNDPGRSGDYEGVAAGGRWTGLVKTLPQRLADPLGWRKPRVIFVNSMSDLFHADVPDEFIGAVFGVMAACPWHTFIVLTKRMDRAAWWARRVDAHAAARFGLRSERLDLVRGQAARLCPACPAPSDPHAGGVDWPLPNVIIGTSVWDQPSAEQAIPYLLEFPAACRVVSAEPLMGPLDLTRLRVRVPNWDDPLCPAVYINALSGHVAGPDDVLDTRIGWVVAGGQTGPGARPVHPQWARDLRDQCAGAGTPFLWKHNGMFTADRRTFIGKTHWINKAAGWIGGTGARCIGVNGRECRRGADFDDPGVYPVAIAYPSSKVEAGREVDGVTHDGYPAAALRVLQSA